MAATASSARIGADTSLLPIIVESCNGLAGRLGGWHIETTGVAHPLWIMVRNSRSTYRQQGWKLHVSAGITFARAVLDQALDVLLAEHAEFKVVASLARLAELNAGASGDSQIGKFITVYPNDDQQAVRLALALHEATRGLRGPAIPSDQPLTPGSLVYYRYGGFIHQHTQTLSGAIVPAVSTPEGDLVPDLRGPYYQAPAWTDDPFRGAVVASAPQPLSPLLNNRYLVMETLYHSPGGAVARAIDIKALQRCIIKRAARDAQMQLDGQDARDRLRSEAAVLADLSPDQRFPAIFDLFEQNQDLFLVMEDMAGETLEQHVGSLANQGCCVPVPQALAWGRELTQALGELHAKGFVHCDLKLSNVIVTPEQRLRLIDFDLACERANQSVLYSQGTSGYASPQQVAGERPAVADDVYSLGALLYSLVTGVDPTLAPQRLALLDRPLALLNPSVGQKLARLIASCLEPDPAKRLPSMAALDVALADANAESIVARPLCESELIPARRAAVWSRYAVIARQLGKSLAAAVQQHTGQEGWLADHDHFHQSRDLYDGRAGALLALAVLSSSYDDHWCRAALAAGAHSLRLAPSLSVQPLPGLYIGEAGVGLALLRAGQALGDVELIEIASELGRWIATLPYTSPDLLLGTAGRLRYHLLLWEASAEPEQLDYAREAGEELLALAERAGADQVRWNIPPGYDHLSGRAYCGLAHGAAGIGDALLDLFEATGENRFLAAAQGAGRWLAGLAVPALEDGSGLSWPEYEGGPLTSACWYDGATGIGRFFLHAAVLGALPEAADLAARAAQSAAWGARWAGPTQARGLAGNIEFLIDMFQATSDHAYLAQAYELASLLEAWIEEREHRPVCLSGWPETLSASYMTGYTGIALCLLRLAYHKYRPY
jgi:serine/threonine protein kinase